MASLAMIEISMHSLPLMSYLNFTKITQEIDSFRFL